MKVKGVNYFLKQKGGFFKKLSEFTYFLYKRNGWMFDFSRYWKNFRNVEIREPVFLLGTEGGGLTLTSRMIRRNRDFVSVTGNYNYWSGSDEMQLVLGSILPSEFTGIKHNLPRKLQELNVSGNCLYATDEFIDYYRKASGDVTPKLKRKFRKIIRWQIARHAINKETARFTDKSQVFTVKVSFINEILKDTNPKFLLVTRDPYATAYKFANTNVKNYTNKIGKGYKEALKIAAQHWANSMKYALKDSQEADLFTVKFEDILNEPEEEMKKVCNFIEIDFDEDLLPQPEHEIPFGSKGKNKWYPLRPDVNQKYFDEMTQEDVEIIHSVVKKQAQRLGYDKPNL